MTRIITLLSLAGLAAGVFMPSSDHPTVPDNPMFAAYGGSIAIAGADIFVSEPRGFRYPGTIHVYQKSGDSWERVDSIRKTDGEVGDQFGSTIAADGDILAVGDARGAEGNGAVHIYRRDKSSGKWTPSEILGHPSNASGTRFGSSVAVSGDFVLIGAPSSNENEGAVHVFHRSSSKTQLTYAGLLPTSALAAGGAFGSALAVKGSMAVVGAPMSNQRSGSVYVYHLQDADQWTEVGRITREDDADSGMRYGSAVATNGILAFAGSASANEFRGMATSISIDGSTLSETAVAMPDLDGKPAFGALIAATKTDLLVSAPQDRGGAGSVFHYTLEDGKWAYDHVFQPGEANTRVRAGTALGFTDDVLVVGAAGDAYGEGSAFFIDRTPDAVGGPKKLFADTEPFPRIEGEQIDCADGDAAGFDCTDIDLVSFIPNVDMGIARGVRLNDVWGWTDPESGKEYALIGHMEGTEFLDMSNPNNPVHLGTLDRTEGARANTWRDIKVYKDHAFIVADGAGDHGIQIFDLTQLRDVSDPPVEFTVTALYSDVHSAHNIVINEDTGFAYTVGGSSGGETCGGGLYMIDIREPANPEFVGCFADPSTGRASTGGSHDSQCVMYEGPDSQYRGREICFSANETAISIADVTDKENPKAISTGSYPDFAYIHQGWLSDDHTYYFQNDEGDETSGKVEQTRTLVWDIRDLDDPIMVREYFAEDSATDHNLYVKGTLLYSTNNSAGLRIIDISDPVNPVEVGHFDTTPHGNNAAGFDGTWSSYPYFESGVIVVTSRREGVFFLKKKETDI